MGLNGLQGGVDGGDSLHQVSLDCGQRGFLGPRTGHGGSGDLCSRGDDGGTGREVLGHSSQVGGVGDDLGTGGGSPGHASGGVGQSRHLGLGGSQGSTVSAQSGGLAEMKNTWTEL